MSKQFCIVITYNSNSAETGYLDNNIIINGLYLLLLVCMQGVREKIIVYKMGALLLIKGKKFGHLAQIYRQVDAPALCNI